MPIIRVENGLWHCRARNGKETFKETRSEARQWISEQMDKPKPKTEKPAALQQTEESEKIGNLKGDHLFRSIERILLEGHDLEGVNTNPNDIWARKGNLARLSYKPDKNASESMLSGRLFIAGTPFGDPFKAVYAFVLHLRRMGAAEIRRVKRK